MLPLCLFQLLVGQRIYLQIATTTGRQQWGMFTMKVTVALGITISLMGIASPLHAQILSPGKLGQGHIEFEGLSNCTQCHELGSKIDGAKCGDCHDTIKSDVAKFRGFHGQLARDKKPCMECHKDHRGRKANLAEWDTPKEKFDHALTTWELTGKHSDAKCESCHEPR